MHQMQQKQQKNRRSSKRRARELRRRAAQIGRREKEDPRDILYDLTGEWEPAKTHEWDEF